MMSFMSIPTTLQEYNDGSLTQKRWWFKAQYPHERFIMEELDDANSIHLLNRSEEKKYVERFWFHLRLVDIPRDALYALATPVIQQ